MLSCIRSYEFCLNIYHNTTEYYVATGYCINSVELQQKPKRYLGNNKLAIIPHLNFSCNGRITSIKARVNKTTNFTNFLYFQVWRPSSTNSLVYHEVSEVQLKSDKQVTKSIAHINFTGKDTLEFQSGDVIGYYHPHQPCYRVTDIKTNGYILYQFNGSPPNHSVNISEASKTFNSKQPLIQFIVGMKILVY